MTLGGGRRAATREWGDTRGDGQGWHDDDDYNNRDFRGLGNRGTRFCPRPDTERTIDFSYELQYDQRYRELFPEG